VVLAPLNNLAEDSFIHLFLVSNLFSASTAFGSYEWTYIRDRNGVVLANGLVANVVKHVLDEHGALSDDTICKQNSVKFPLK
jgi:hypothetical protein